MTDKSDKIPFSVRLTRTEHTALARIASQTGFGVTITNVIHEAIRRMIDAERHTDR